MKTKLTETKFKSAIRLGFVGLIASATTAWAGSPAFEGIVKDSAGRPIKGAEVRIEAKNFSKIAKTDASGHYACDGLAVGTYKVTLVVNGSVAASTLNAKTKPGSHTQLNFNLTAKTVSATKHTHQVWCPNETGTHIGGNGQWIDVDDNGNIVNNTGVNSNTGTSSVEKVGRSIVQTPHARPNSATYGGQ
jgi:carboxypeptidase family protein